MAFSFKERTDATEIMDDLALGGQILDQTLSQLSQVHKWLGGTHTLAGVKALCKQETDPSNPIRITDLGCGGGDVLRQLAAWGRKQGIPMSLHGIDANPHVIAYAQSQSTDWPEITYEVADCFSSEMADRDYDILTCNLMLHHFPSDVLPELLQKLRKMARKGIIINDLHRSPVAWLAFAFISRVLGASYMIRHDGLVSIRRGFRLKELQQLFTASHIQSYTLQWRWAFRYLAIIPTQPSTA